MNQFEYEATLRDYKEEGRAEGLAEGRAEGRAEGLAEGLAEGRAEGLAEGLVKGRDEASVQIARAMKTEGVPDKIILKTTGVDPATL